MRGHTKVTPIHCGTLWGKRDNKRNDQDTGDNNQAQENIMLVVMKNDATDGQIQAVIKQIEKMGYKGIPMPGALRTAICIIGNRGPVDAAQLCALDGVKEAIPVTKPYKLVGRETHPESTVITIGEVKIGGGEPVIMAGPCAVESEEQALTIASFVKKHGAAV